MKVEIRSDCVVLDGYVNAVARDSRVMLDEETRRKVCRTNYTTVLLRELCKWQEM